MTRRDNSTLCAPPPLSPSGYGDPFPPFLHPPRRKRPSFLFSLCRDARTGKPPPSLPGAQAEEFSFFFFSSIWRAADVLCRSFFFPYFFSRDTFPGFFPPHNKIKIEFPSLFFEHQKASSLFSWVLATGRNTDPPSFSLRNLLGGFSSSSPGVCKFDTGNPSLSSRQARRQLFPRERRLFFPSPPFEFF